MHQNIPLDPGSTNDRIPAIAKAREAAAHIIPPKMLLDLWPRTKSVRDTYLSIAACIETGIKQPTVFELTCVSGLSVPSVMTAIRKLEAVGLLIRTQAESRGSGVRYDYMIPPLSEGCK
jgi:hypothetical protein